MRGRRDANGREQRRCRFEKMMRNALFPQPTVDRCSSTETRATTIRPSRRPGCVNDILTVYFRAIRTTQASEAARDWAAKRKEAMERAKQSRARRDDGLASRARQSAKEEEERRLARRVKAAENAASERAAKREAEALAAKIRKEVELELASEREREIEAECGGAEGDDGKPTTVYAKVVPDGTPIETPEIELAPEPEKKKPATATPKGDGVRPVERGVERLRVDETREPEPEKKRAPAPTPRGVKLEWSPPKAMKKAEGGKRSRSPLASNNETEATKTKVRPGATKPSLTKSSIKPTPGAKPQATTTRPARPVGNGARSSVPPVKKTASRDEEKVHRQMFDKRESRRMNRTPFSASVKRWRDKNLGANTEATTSVCNDASSTAPGSINVYARKRPLFDPERKKGEYDVVSVKDANTAVVHNCQMHADLKRMFVKHCAYTLSGGVFDDKVQEHEVYARSAAPLVAQTLKGGVGALFMYGQTGSGKTHTMENIEKHAMDALFIGDGEANVPGATCITVSYFEIQGKTCVDLLQPGRVELRLKELFEEQGDELVGQMEVELMGAKEPTVENAADLKKVIDEGKSRRQTSATQCNAASSRSHAVMRLTVTLSDGSKGRLTLVDCAGSERKEDNTHHNEKQRKETAEINASLYALKECVRFRRLKFSGGKSNVHVPYRNSPLTRVLAECFVREDASVAVIGTMSPASIDTEHSIATLKTINAIGGNDDTEGYAEQKEDVSAALRIDAKTGEVTEKAAERLIAPVKWSHAEVTEWIATAARGAFKTVKIPSTLTGSQFVRMSPLVLKNMCGGDEALAAKLHKCLRAEVTRCSVTQR